MAITLEEARKRIGDGVVYRAAPGDYEDGVITSVADQVVFVRYAGDNFSKATYPRDLNWLASQ